MTTSPAVPALAIRGLRKSFGGLTSYPGSISQSPPASGGSSLGRTALARQLCST